MSRHHVFAALLGLALPVLALAGPGTKTEAEISNPQIDCGLFGANIKNTGPVAATYASTFVMTKQGECTKFEKDKNPDGSKCKTGQLCIGYCAAYGPDKDVKFTPIPKTMSIPAGATKPLRINAENVLMKKAEITVLEEGKVSPVSESMPVRPPCIK